MVDTTSAFRTLYIHMSGVFVQALMINISDADGKTGFHMRKPLNLSMWGSAAKL